MLKWVYKYTDLSTCANAVLQASVHTTGFLFLEELSPEISSLRGLTTCAYFGINLQNWFVKPNSHLTSVTILGMGQL